MSPAASPFTIRNIRLFIAFRILFNCRFYYPIFTVLFLDYGLTIEQFSLLNTVWAITIVCAEVPSGALADILGRRRLLLATALLMVVEMGVIAFIPLADPTLVFWAFLINRVVSGLAEAMASGADEAIAYDSLSARGMADQWPRVLSLQMRLKSIGSILTALFGALVYDPDMVNRILSWLGANLVLNQQQTMRFPVVLTLLLAVFATLTALLFDEDTPSAGTNHHSFFTKLGKAMAITLDAGRWILVTPFAFAVIFVGMYYDHILRLLITLSSQYLRLIDLPEASFGAIAAAMSLLGLYVPKLCEMLVLQRTPRFNVLLLLAVTLAATLTMRGFYPYIGIVAIVFVYIGLNMVSFFTSHYLNQAADSAQRATVLSFKGMAFNLGYGGIGVVFALLMQNMRSMTAAAHPSWSTSHIEDQSFILSIGWVPWYTLVLFGGIVVWYILRRGKRLSQGGS